MPYLVPMSSPDLSDAERQAVQAVLNTPNLSMGREIEQFEAAFCQYTSSSQAVGVNSGTAGLHLCIRAVDVQPGDLVLTTPFSFVASTNVVLFENAVPVFVDVDPKTYNMTAELVEAKINPKTKAIIPVHLYGHPANMPAITNPRNPAGTKRRKKWGMM